MLDAKKPFVPDHEGSWPLWGEGALRGVFPWPGLGLDKISILLRSSIGVLKIESAELDPPYIISWNLEKLRI